MAEKSKRLNPETFEMIFGFVLREKRFLKKRETSLSQEELNAAEDVFKRLIKAVSAKKMPPEQLREMEANEAKARKLAAEIESKCRPLTRKQLAPILKHYGLVHAVIEKKHKEQKVVLENLTGDKFYKPRKRNY